jgi:glycosyltransferase involved in cell wall biosynthesis
MKILSFTNLPVQAVYDHFNTGNKYFYQGWIEGLKSSLEKNEVFELGFASLSEDGYEKFVVDKTVYYNIQPPRNHRFIRAWYDHWQHKIDFHGEIEQCLQIVDDFKPDIIHIHGTEGFFGLLSSYVNIPVVISLQGILTVIKNQYFMGLQYSDLIRQIFTKDFIRGTGVLHQFLNLYKAAKREKTIIENNKYFIGRTDFDHGVVNLLNPSSVYFACNEVLRPEFYNYRWKPEKDSQTTNIYIVSGTNPFKGVGVLIDAVALLKNQYDIKLRISGPFNNSWIGSLLNNKIDKLGLTNRVEFLGLSSPDQVASEMEKASIFVHPSYMDNSPNSLAEAMLVGVPCIASYVGGIPSMINNNENGLLFPAGDPFLLAVCIKRFINDEILKNRVSENARITALSRHDPITIAEKMKNIYQQIIAS